MTLDKVHNLVSKCVTRDDSPLHFELLLEHDDIISRTERGGYDTRTFTSASEGTGRVRELHTRVGFEMQETGSG